MARHKEPVQKEHADAIVEWISQGKTLREWCRQNDWHFSTVYDWLAKDEDFARRFAHAREIGQDCIADETLEIIDTFPLGSGDDGKLDGAHVTWLRNRAEYRLKLLAKWNPKKWGDRVDLTSKGEAVGLIININKKAKKNEDPDQV